jgi:NhaP-type Na+/H+ or K+/H+ antiporter
MLLAILVTLVFLHGLVSARLERTVFTAPILFTVAGALSLFLVPELRTREASHQALLHVAEIGLVLLLFTDASRTDLSVLRKASSMPARLLSTGMLLTLALGAAAARFVFPDLTWWEAGIAAAILAPTDAGLGQLIVNSPRVPMKIRQALNVEAGLNDGLSVPFLLFFMALAGGGAAGGHSSLTRFIVEQLGYGALVGLGVGLAGGGLLGLAYRRGWIAASWQQLCVVALPLLCLLASEATGASMFIAAFVGGLAVQIGFREAGRHSVEFAEQWGQLFNLTVFFLFGVLVARSWVDLNWRHWLYAALSLTVVRMVPVSIALLGTRLHRATVLFMGWFGPRGLASIVLGLVFLEQEIRSPGESAIRLAVMATVCLSIFAHGLSALPGTETYARLVHTLPPDAPECEDGGFPAPGSGRTHDQTGA